MPSPQDDRELRIPFLDGASNFNRLPDYRSGHQRDTKAARIANFFEDTLFVVWSDRGIDEADLIPGTKQRRRDREDAQRRRRIRTCERREEKNNLAGLGQGILLA